jgi:hypothetical protein
MHAMGEEAYRLVAHRSARRRLDLRSLLAERVHAEKLIRGAEVDKGRRKRDETDQAPICLRTNEDEAQKQKTRRNADDPICLADIRFHFISPFAFISHKEMRPRADLRHDLVTKARASLRRG